MRFSGSRVAKRGGGGGGVDVIFERISRAIKIFLTFLTISVFIFDSRQLHKFYTCKMATALSKPPRSHRSNFFHDLVTVDFHQTVPLSLGVRIAAILIIILVLGLITGHSAEASFVYIGTIFVLIVDILRSKGPRTRVLLTVSILYASIFAIGMVISINDNLAVPLCGLGLFIISYFAVYTKAFWTLFYAAIVFVIAITFQGATPSLAGQNFLLIFVGGLWAIVGGIIFLPRKTSKQQRTVTADPIQDQPQPQLTWQDRFRPLTSNLSIHSHHLQYAIVFAITGVVSMLIIQWFKLSEGDWVLISVVNILVPGFSDITLTLNKAVHRTIGTIIGAIIALIIIDSVHNIWLLSLLFFVFSIALVTFASRRITPFMSSL
jgi:hypothetical protein